VPFSPTLRRAFWRGIAWPNRLALVRSVKRRLGQRLFSLSVRNSLVGETAACAPDEPESSIGIDVSWLGRRVGRLCACRMWEHIGLPGWWLSGVWVHPALRGMGLAERLLNEAQREAARSGIAELWLNVDLANASAIALYRKLGYRAPSDDSYQLAIGAYHRQVGNPPEQLVLCKRLARK
jgi:ribosomal protein S18 acetylase RimI-like enzyme